MQVPSEYAEGYEQARLLDPDLAEAYIQHTLVGDPLGDAAMNALAELGPAESHRLINAGMERDGPSLQHAPTALREFFGTLDNPPQFYDPKKALPGMRAFHKHSEMFFVGLVLAGALTGFTTGVSKSFSLTGRLAGNVRRVMQNTRHLVEVTLPGGLDRLGDGWKLTVRIRLIHAQMRRLLLKSGDWNEAADGIPLHIAHMALAATGFSAINLQAVRKLGVQLTEEESAGFMHIWRYVTWLLGVPEEILFEGESDALHLKDIGYICEPRPAVEAITMAHGIIDVIPESIGIEDPAERKKLLNSLYRISRALIGNEMADNLDYPKQMALGVLPLVRMQQRSKAIRSRIMPRGSSDTADNFIGLLQRSVYDDMGISYFMPDAVKDSESTPW